MKELINLQELAPTAKIEQVDRKHLEQWRIYFPNGYALSLIKGRDTHSDENTVEVAVLKKYIDGWHLTYDTSLTNDVIGYVDREQLIELINEVQKL